MFIHLGSDDDYDADDAGMRSGGDRTSLAAANISRLK